MKGRTPGASEPRDPHRDLLCRMLLLAVADARRGDKQAREWLQDGASLAFDLLDLKPPADDSWMRQSANVRE